MGAEALNDNKMVRIPKTVDICDLPSLSHCIHDGHSGTFEKKGGGREGKTGRVERKRRDPRVIVRNVHNKLYSVCHTPLGLKSKKNYRPYKALYKGLQAPQSPIKTT